MARERAVAAREQALVRDPVKPKPRASEGGWDVHALMFSIDGVAGDVLGKAGKPLVPVINVLRS